MTNRYAGRTPGRSETAEKYARLRNEIQVEMDEVQAVHTVFASALYSDDQFMRKFKSTMHQLTVNRLLSSLDHLQLAAHSLEHGDDGLVYSQYSLVRPGLAIASTALWLVCGESDLRRMRGLNLASYDLAQQVTFSRTVLDATGRIDPRNEALKAECRTVVAGAPERFQSMYEAYCAIRANETDVVSTPKELRKFRETDVITEVSKYMHDKKHLSNAHEILLQYRMMSGFVHGLIWSTYAGTKVRNFQGEKSAMVELRGNPENVYRGARTALTVARLAKARFIELCEYSR
ncbi:hypothetical protein [Mycolicibacterium peregrinum]|uniref:hypothetical protein n=1 Tax=Mycolicibacterium peregrinum TaxID=43304 RepID=UPI0010422F3F|nr:hypothetical protein [Mycolicibacterium peregrinum]